MQSQAAQLDPHARDSDSSVVFQQLRRAAPVRARRSTISASAVSVERLGLPTVSLACRSLCYCSSLPHLRMPYGPFAGGDDDPRNSPSQHFVDYAGHDIVAWIEEGWILPCQEKLARPFWGLCTFGPVFMFFPLFIGIVALVAWCESRGKKKDAADPTSSAAIEERLKKAHAEAIEKERNAKKKKEDKKKD